MYCWFLRAISAAASRTRQTTAVRIFFFWVCCIEVHPPLLKSRPAGSVRVIDLCLEESPRQEDHDNDQQEEGDKVLVGRCEIACHKGLDES